MLTRIVHLTDLHLLADPEARLHGVPTTETLAAVLSQLETSGGPVERLIVTGDHAHDERLETYVAMRAMLEPWWDRVHFVPGNHDDRRFMREALGDRVQTLGKRLVFSLDVDGWRLVGLDSLVTEKIAGALDGAQIDWLAEIIGESGARSVGVFLHHPPAPVGNPWMDAIGLEAPEPFVDLVRASPQVRFVACGHVHHAFESRLGDAVFLTTPSTGLQFDPGRDVPRITNEAPGYRVFELDGERFRTEVVRLPELALEPEQPA